MIAGKPGFRPADAGAGRVALRSVARRYGTRAVLEDLDLMLPEGQTTVLTGANGSGKTTVARLLLGLDEPDSGTVEGVAGRRVGAVFQENRLCGQLSARGNVRLVLARQDWSRVEPALAAVGLSEAAMMQPVGELSGGQQRRVAIVRGLVGDADLVVLDEPFTGLDVDAKPHVMRYVRKRLGGVTALVITHDVTEAHELGAPVVRLGPAAPGPSAR